MSKSIPDRWIKYDGIGVQIPRTRFIAFKVPLKEAVQHRVPENKRLTPSDLLQRIPNLGLIIDLTNTKRYYDSGVFTKVGIEHIQINVPGHHVPDNKLIDKFKLAVLSFLNKNSDNDKLIGVHCTHGVNRTGFMICHFMITELSIKPSEAIKTFRNARGYGIERQNYIAALYSAGLETLPTSTIKTDHTTRREQFSWRRNSRGDTQNWRSKEPFNSVPYTRRSETFELKRPLRTTDSDIIRKIYNANFTLDPAGKTNNWREHTPPRDDRRSYEITRDERRNVDKSRNDRGNRRPEEKSVAFIDGDGDDKPRVNRQEMHNNTGKRCREVYKDDRGDGITNPSKRYGFNNYRRTPELGATCRDEHNRQTLPEPDKGHSILLVKKWPDNPYK